MMLNSLYNLQSSSLFETKNAYFSSDKQSSEVSYQQVERETAKNNVVNFKNIDDSNNLQNSKTAFNGYYDMFVASQALQNSKILKNCNYQMHMKMHA